MTDIPDTHPIRAFVIETGSIKDGFQRACEHIATLEAKLAQAERDIERLRKIENAAKAYEQDDRKLDELRAALQGGDDE